MNYLIFNSLLSITHLARTKESKVTVHQALGFNNCKSEETLVIKDKIILHPHIDRDTFWFRTLKNLQILMMKA